MVCCSSWKGGVAVRVPIDLSSLSVAELEKVQRYLDACMYRAQRREKVSR
jgi:hypothetical protein